MYMIAKQVGLNGHLSRFAIQKHIEMRTMTVLVSDHVSPQADTKHGVDTKC